MSALIGKVVGLVADAIYDHDANPLVGPSDDNRALLVLDVSSETARKLTLREDYELVSRVDTTKREPRTLLYWVVQCEKNYITEASARDRVARKNRKLALRFASKADALAHRDAAGFATVYVATPVYAKRGGA